MNIVQDNWPLRVLVCGYERGGTTLVSELLRQHPQLDGGFEGGFLLNNEATEFPATEPYATNLRRGWGLSPAQLEEICQQDTWSAVYAGLRQHAQVLDARRRDSVGLIDKTPAYMQVLADVMKKVPAVPCIVIVRDPRALLWSWAKRANAEGSLKEWMRKAIAPSCKRYVAYGRGLRKAQATDLTARIFVVQYEALCVDPQTWSQRIFDFIGMDYDEGFQEFDPKWPNVYGSSVSRRFLCEYQDGFPAEVCERILRDTRELADFRWEGCEHGDSAPV